MFTLHTHVAHHAGTPPLEDTAPSGGEIYWVGSVQSMGSCPVLTR